MGRGDHIYVWRSVAGVVPFQHHGIDCGDETVIHYTDRVGDGQNFIVQRTSLSEFALGEKIFYREYKLADMPHVVIQRAESKLGASHYHVFANNCEHFATWCMTGVHQSEQVNQKAAEAVGVVGTGLGSVGTGFVAKAATDMAFRSLSPISKIAVNLGLKSAPAATGTLAMGVAAVGAVPGVVAQLAVNKALEDDENLPDAERQARKAGRKAAGISGTVAIVAVAAAPAVLAAAPAVLAVAAIAPAAVTVIGGYGAYYLNRPKDKAYK